MVKQLLRRTATGIMRVGGAQLMRTALRMGQRTAIDTALGVATNAMPGTTERIHTQVFNVTPPVTVYLRASYCRVTVRHTDTSKVHLEANLQRTFGIEFSAEQDDAGVYIVVRRKPVVGAVSRIEFTLVVPRDTHLALHLTPGDIVFEGIDGIAELPSTQVFSSHSAHKQSDPRDM